MAAFVTVLDTKSDIVSPLLFGMSVVVYIAKAPDPHSRSFDDLRDPRSAGPDSSSEERGELVDPAAPAECVAAVGAALLEGATLAGDLGAVHAHAHVLRVILKEIGR